MTVFNLHQIISSITHNSLTTYRTRNSKVPNAAYADTTDKKGAVFVVRKKTDFANGRVRGFIVTSKETLAAEANRLTHWTPNTYQRFGYTDDTRTYIKGFEDANLSQINTFVVDIDTKRHSVNDIMLACIDNSIGEPSMVLETPNGYQVYFILAQPIFISNKNNFRSLVVAKRIANNLKLSLSSVNADMYCNDFGFFRMPNAHNVVWYSEARYTVKELINWSMRQDDEESRTLFVVPHKMTSRSVMESEWFAALLHATDIKGQKGQIGRNNTLFTLALVCYQEGMDKGRAYDLLDEFNSNLRYPLSVFDMRATLNSAYCGKYNGASRSYVESLLETYVVGGSDFTVSLGSTYWYKHKKERKDRVRSHYDEWEQDIIDYLTDKQGALEPFVWHTQKELCAAVGIAQSSLNVVMKKSNKLLKTVVGRGCTAKTGWTTIGLFLTLIMRIHRAQSGGFKQGLDSLIHSYVVQLAPVAGYELLRVILSRRDGPPDEQLTMFALHEAAS